MSHVPTVLKSDRSVFDKMLPVDDNAPPRIRSTPAYASTDVPAHLISVLPIRSGRSKENSKIKSAPGYQCTVDNRTSEAATTERSKIVSYFTH